MPPSSKDVTQMLSDWRQGHPEALDRLMPVVYDELPRLADRYLRGERRDHTLQTTALVHEAYLQLVDQKEAHWRNRAHFLAIAAQLMRRILVEHARSRRAAKRGGPEQKVTLDESLELSTKGDISLAALDDALTALEACDPQQSRIVELRFFGGLTVDETAEALGISPRTVSREWRMARAWLHRELEKSD